MHPPSGCERWDRAAVNPAINWHTCRSSRHRQRRKKWKRQAQVQPIRAGLNAESGKIPQMFVLISACTPAKWRNYVSLFLWRKCRSVDSCLNTHLTTVSLGHTVTGNVAGCRRDATGSLMITPWEQHYRTRETQVWPKYQGLTNIMLVFSLLSSSLTHTQTLHLPSHKASRLKKHRKITTIEINEINWKRELVLWWAAMSSSLHALQMFTLMSPWADTSQMTK